jgi:hypothetical protein
MDTDDDNLELFDICMKHANIFYWVGEGTALGFIREGGIIEGDSDVDVGMYYENKQKYYESCLPLLLDNGFKVFRENPHSIIKNNCYIDVDFIGKGYPSMTYRWPNIPDEWIHLIEPFSKKNVRGIEYNVPSINYIIYLYGEDYLIPKPNFKPWHTIKNNSSNKLTQFMNMIKMNSYKKNKKNI